MSDRPCWILIFKTSARKATNTIHIIISFMPPMDSDPSGPLRSMGASQGSLGTANGIPGEPIGVFDAQILR